MYKRRLYRKTKRRRNIREVIKTNLWRSYERDIQKEQTFVYMSKIADDLTI